MRFVSHSIMLLMLLAIPSWAADPALDKILADWKRIREKDEKSTFEWTMSVKMGFRGDKPPLVSDGRLTIEWKQQKYQLQYLSKVDDGFKLRKIMFDGKERTTQSYPSAGKFEASGPAEKSTIATGDFTATQFDNSLFPLLLQKRVVITRANEMYRDGSLWVEPDATQLYIDGTDGALIRINVYPRTADKNRSNWQYIVDPAKDAVIKSMVLWNHFQGKPDEIFVRYDMSYKKVGSDWILDTWKKTDYSEGKPRNIYEGKITKYIRDDRISSILPPQFLEGDKVAKQTFPPFDPMSKRQLEQEDMIYSDGSLVKSGSRFRNPFVWILAAATISVVGFVAMFVVRRNQKGGE